MPVADLVWDSPTPVITKLNIFSDGTAAKMIFRLRAVTLIPPQP